MAIEQLWPHDERPEATDTEPTERYSYGVHQSKAEPELDARFTYANERTFLAWNRTALALIATGVAATQLLPKFQVAWGRRILGLPLIALGALVAAESLRHWRASEHAMQKGEALPRSSMPLVLSVGIVIVGLTAAVIAAFGTS
ncbi:MAG: YidH family protein [Acidimicrobiales bacterium]|jgi:putative membrane protein